MQKILVVNNDLDTMSLLKNWLEKKFYSVTYTSSADDVPKLIKTFAPDLMLVDVLQKEVVNEINKNGHRNIPVILMTGYTVRQDGVEVPTEDVIEKPFNPQILEKKIIKLMR